MDQHDHAFLLLCGFLVLVVVLGIAMVYRLYLDRKYTLEERYADDLSAGRAIIIPADPRNKIKAVIYVVILGSAFFLFQRQLHLYITQLDQTCAGFYGWNSWFLTIGNFYAFIYIFIASMFIITWRLHRQVFRDGYAPLWPYNTDKAYIAFKLTPKIKLKWRLILGIQLIAVVYCLLAPIIMLHIFRFTLDSTLPQQFHTFNERLQADCRKDLHQHSLNPTSAPTPSPLTSPPNPATASTHP